MLGRAQLDISAALAVVMSGVERIPLSDQDVAYLVGRSGATRMRLERFSGARLNIDKDTAEVMGSNEERSLAKLAISITLQQRNGGQVTTDFDDLEEREDVSTFDVPKETVGFLLGAKGSTLRQMETNHKVFMFFNNDKIRQGKHVRNRRRARARVPSVLASPHPAATRHAQGRATCYACFASSRFLTSPRLALRNRWR